MTSERAIDRLIPINRRVIRYEEDWIEKERKSCDINPINDEIIR